MELSLFSRDTIAMATAIALTHDMFDAALMLGVCDKIVPGLLIGALHFGHLPTVFVPPGRCLRACRTAPSRRCGSKPRRAWSAAPDFSIRKWPLITARHCTFYGTANSNQMLLEAMGLHVPGTAFIQPGDAMRESLTREAVRTVLGKADDNAFRCPPIGEMVDERCIVNAMVALLATGGSTNHLIHWVAVARAAGIVIDWNDFTELSEAVPLLARVYPNGSADVNEFQNAGGPGAVIGELVDAGLMHGDVATVRVGGIAEFGHVPVLNGNALRWSAARPSKDTNVVRTVAEPFSASGGLKLLTGNLGRSVIKISSVPADRHVIEAPARVFDSQAALQTAFTAGELDRDVVCVVRWQGPKANGMPELHKLTPPLAVLQGKGFKVVLVTDGRMSGASGRVPAAIHVSPEAAAGGPLAKVRDGDVIRLDGVAGKLQVLVADDEWAAREVVAMPDALRADNGLGLGRELFAGMRRNALSAEEGACTWL